MTGLITEASELEIRVCEMTHMTKGIHFIIFIVEIFTCDPSFLYLFLSVENTRNNHFTIRILEKHDKIRSNLNKIVVNRCR